MDPALKPYVDVFVWLGSVNAGFWLLARGLGLAVHVFAELFWEPLWGALATLVNIVLAVLLAAVLMASAVHGAPAGDLWWRRMCGFVLLYVALSASFHDARADEVDEYAKLGFAMGLFAYVVFAVVPDLTSSPRLDESLVVMKELSDSWLGRAMTVFVTAGVLWRLATQGLSGLFHVLAPFLYWVGLIKHPAIRVRRR